MAQRHSGGILTGAGFVRFDALEARSRRIASGLAALGVGPGACAAIAEALHSSGDTRIKYLIWNRRI